MLIWKSVLVGAAWISGGCHMNGPLSQKQNLDVPEVA